MCCPFLKDGILIREGCRGTGPATFNCSEFAGMRQPANACIVMNDPYARSLPPPVPRFPGDRAEIGNSRVQLP